MESLEGAYVMKVKSSGMGLVSYKRGSPEIPSPFHYVKTQREVSGLQPGRGSSPYHAEISALISDLQPPEV